MKAQKGRWRDVGNCCCSFTKSWLFVTLWTSAPETFLSFNISRSFLTFISIELVMLSNHLILCHPLLLLPSIFSSISLFLSWLLASGDQSIQASTSASVLPHTHTHTKITYIILVEISMVMDIPMRFQA